MILRLEACEVDLVRSRVTRGESSAPLTGREAGMLGYLAERPLQAVGRDELLTRVWGYSDAVVSRACDNAAARLRDKIEADPKNPRHLLTVFGVGYRFVPLGVEVAVAPEAPVAAALILGDRTVNLALGQVAGPAGVTALTPPEIRVLERLLEAHGATVDRVALLRATGGVAGRRAVDNLVLRLRRKLERDPAAPEHLLTGPGGYRLAVSAPTTERPVEGLIGRSGLVDAVGRATEAHRFVILVGPAGVGKTALAQRWADERSALWADLRSAGSADEVAERVARALGREVGGQDPARAVLVEARTRGTLRIVLDDLDAAADTVGPLIELWTAGAPEVRWLGTSRIRTGAAREEVVEVPPLAVDDGVTLLRRAPTLRDADPALLAAVVRRVDGLPLAIQLAAGRSAVLGPQAVLDRMGLDLLADPRATGPHASLREALRWSFALLSDPEVDALLVLSLLRRFDIGDAEALLGDDAIDRVQALRDHSLLRTEPVTADDPVLRLACWEGVRDYAAELLNRRPDQGASEADRVVGWLAGGPDEDDPLVAERLADLRHAVGLAVRYDLPDGARCARIAAGWYLAHGPYPPAIELLRQALGIRSIRPADRAWVRATLGGTLYSASRFEEAEATVQLAVEEARRADVAGAEARALGTLAQCAMLAGRLDESGGWWDQAADAAERAGDPGLAAYDRGTAATGRGRYDEAERELERCRRSYPADHPIGGAHATWLLGRIASLQGRLSVARVRYALAVEWTERHRRDADWLGVAGALLMVCASLGEDGVDVLADRVVAAAIRDETPFDEAIAWMTLGSWRLFRGEVDQADQALARCRPRLDQVAAAPAARAFAMLREAEVALIRGQAAVALTGAIEVHRVGRELGNRSATSFGGQVAAMAEIALGRPERAAVRLDEALAPAPPSADAHLRALSAARWGVVARVIGRDAVADQLRAEAEHLAPETGVTARSELGHWLGRLRA